MIHMLPEMIASSHPMGFIVGPNHRECNLNLKHNPHFLSASLFFQ